MAFYCPELFDFNGVIYNGYFDASVTREWLFDLNGQYLPVVTDKASADAICQAYYSRDSLELTVGSSGNNSAFDLTAFKSLMDSYFAFDSALFEQILGFTIVAFAIGYGAGVVSKILKRA